MTEQGLLEAEPTVVPTGSKWIAGISPDQPVCEVAGRVLDARLTAVCHSLPLAAEKSDEDVEHVHQLRLAILQERVGINAQEEPPELPPIPVFQVEELVNAVTHGVGLVLSIAGAIVLIARSYSQGDAYCVVGCTVFAITLIAVYAASTLSHTPLSPRLRRLFRSLDQGAIYLLIVGTCMPFALTYLRSGWWFLFFGLMWTVALCGFLSKVLFWHRVESVAIWSHFLLGCMPIATIPWLMEAVPAAALWWMLIGGLCYACGTLFLVLDNRHPLFHGGWHVFVILGSTCNFMTILFFVADSPKGT